MKHYGPEDIENYYPERSFDQSEGWQRAEEAAKQTQRFLPNDFPGFMTRKTGGSTYCYTDTGERTPFVSYRVYYSIRGFESPPLDRYFTTDYDSLKTAWQNQGFDNIREWTSGPNDEEKSIEADRPDGVHLWYTAGPEYGVGLTIQTGCMRAVEGFEEEYIPPLDSVNREGDKVGSKWREEADEHHGTKLEEENE